MPRIPINIPYSFCSPMGATSLSLPDTTVTFFSKYLYPTSSMTRVYSPGGADMVYQFLDKTDD